MNITLILVVCSLVSLSVAFIPTKLLAWSVNGFNLPLRKVTTHGDITRNAILQVTASLLSENKRARRTPKKSQHATLDEDSLIAKYYGRKQRQITRELREATQAFVDANIKVDLEDDSFLDLAAHFDSEQFQAGQERLVKKRYNVASQILLSNFDVARKECGQMLHTIQDFYSHSNWLENGNKEPYRILGQPGEEIPHVADHNTHTCDDCENSRVVYTIDILNTASMIFSPYSCYNNILEDLKGNGTLTSGYSDQVSMLGRTITKPIGKCSHGGFLDRCSSQQAQGGINKDSPFEIWSPHYYLHEKAVALAYQATVSILQDIRKDVKNDELFGSFLGVELRQQNFDEINVKYIIDMSGKNEYKLIHSIRENSKNLREHSQELGLDIQTQLFVVPLGPTDEGSKSLYKFQSRPTKSENTMNHMLATLDKIVMSAKKNSVIHVFTDTVSSDYYYVDHISDAIARKNLIVYFFFNYSTPSSSSKYLEKRNEKLEYCNSEKLKFASYNRISAASGGQILYFKESDINSLTSFMKFATVNPRSTIFLVSDCLYGTVQFFVPFDSFLEQAVISICGENINVTVTLPNGITATLVKEFSVLHLSSTTYIARANITPTLKGNWTLSITSSGPYSIRIMGSRNMWISERFYQVDPTYVYGYKAINGKMLQGHNVITHLQLSSNKVSLTTANILTDGGKFIKSLANISEPSSGSYAVTFLPPNQPFFLQFKGIDPYGYHFSYITNKIIPVSSVRLSLDEGQTSDLTLKPGDSTSICLVLHNYGNEGNFELRVQPESIETASSPNSFFKYSCSPQTISLKHKESRRVEVFLQVSNEASEGTSVSFIVSAGSSNQSNGNNFLNIFAIVSNGPRQKLNNLMKSEAYKMGPSKNFIYIVAFFLGVHCQLILY